MIYADKEINSRSKRNA